MARILLVEDDKLTRELHETLLKDAGYEVDVAEDGEQGLVKAVKYSYDLILLDIMLPKKDGITFLKQIRKITPRRAKKIVMLTVLNQEPFIKTALRLGADGYLMKSTLAPNEILAEVRGFLGEKTQ